MSDNASIHCEEACKNFPPNEDDSVQEYSYADLDCVGTREIILRTDHSATSQKTPSMYDNKSKGIAAMVAIYENRKTVCSDDPCTDREDELNLHNFQRKSFELFVTDGKRTFWGRFDDDAMRSLGRLTKTDVQSDERVVATKSLKTNTLERAGKSIVSYLLQDRPKISIAYTLSESQRDNDEPAGSRSDDDHLCHTKNCQIPSVKVVVREHLNSGVVKLVWSESLALIRSGFEHCFGTKHPISPITSGSIDTAALVFVKLLGQSRDVALNEICNLKRENSKLFSQMIGWKDTATKLDRGWQLDKDELTERFLILYNKVKGDLRQTMAELEAEKKKNCSILKQTEDHTSCKTFSDREQVVDHEDEHDYEIFDPSYVERLAQGLKTTPVEDKISNSVVLPVLSQSADIDLYDEKISDERDSQDRFAAEDAIRKNPHTGAIEMWNARDIFSQPQDESDAIERLTKKTLKRDKSERFFAYKFDNSSSSLLESSQRQESDQSFASLKKKSRLEARHGSGLQADTTVTNLKCLQPNSVVSQTSNSQSNDTRSNKSVFSDVASRQSLMSKEDDNSVLSSDSTESEPLL